MALMDCPECGRQVSDTALSCPHCGYPKLSETKPVESVPHDKQKRNNIIGWIGIVLAIVIVLAIFKTCVNDTDNINESIPIDTTISDTNEVIHKKEPEQVTNVQKKYKYEFRSIKSYGPYKRIIYIRLREQLGEPELKEIAQQIRKDYPSDKRLLIFYLLPDTDIADGAWATSHYEPNLEINILGTPEEQEAKIEKSTKDTFECDPNNFYSFKNYKSHIWKYVDQKSNLGDGWGRFVTSTDDIRVSSYGNGYYKIDIYEFNASHPDITVSLKFSHQSGMYYYYLPCGNNEYLIKEKLRIVQCVGKMSDMASGRYSSSVIYFIYEDDKSYSEKGIAYKLKG
jgi:hypothetical protein